MNYQSDFRECALLRGTTPKDRYFFMKRKCMFMSFIDEALDPIRIPRFVKVRQNFPRPCVPDPAGELRTGLETGRYLDSVAPGMTVAITAGSRGITNYPLIIRTLVEAVKRRGGEPFIFPAMGSHGGATAEGQKNMLAGLGITEETMGAPVRSTKIGRAPV